VDRPNRPNLQESREKSRGFRAPSDARPAVRGAGILRVSRFLIVRKGAGYDRQALCPALPRQQIAARPRPLLCFTSPRRRRAAPMAGAVSFTNDRLDADLGERKLPSCTNDRSALREPASFSTPGARAGSGGPARSPRASGATPARRSFLSRLFRAISARWTERLDQQQLASLLRGASGLPTRRAAVRFPPRWEP